MSRRSTASATPTWQWDAIRRQFRPSNRSDKLEPTFAKAANNEGAAWMALSQSARARSLLSGCNIARSRVRTSLGEPGRCTRCNGSPRSPAAHAPEGLGTRPCKSRGSNSAGASTDRAWPLRGRNHELQDRPETPHQPPVCARGTDPRTAPKRRHHRGTRLHRPSDRGRQSHPG